MQRYKRSKVRGSGRFKWFNWVVVKDIGVVVRDDIGGAVVYFGGHFMFAERFLLCKDCILGL